MDKEIDEEKSTIASPSMLRFLIVVSGVQLLGALLIACIAHMTFYE
jgi:hypothetical protein